MIPYDFSAYHPPVVTEVQLRAELARRRDARLCGVALLAGFLWLLVPVALYFCFRDLYPQLAMVCLLGALARAAGAALLAAVYFWQKRRRFVCRQVQ